jgi:long-chain fatty acid transport protein
MYRAAWLAAACGFPLAAGATGFRLPDQDAFATARGEAFAATADNASAVYYNPAGLSQLQGHSVRFGLYGLMLDVTYDSPAGGSFDNDEDLFAIPQLFYAFTPAEWPVSFGLGIYSPYGLSTEWPDDTGFRTVATKGELTYYTINPAISYQICSTLSVGAGVSFNQAELDLRQGLLWPSQPFDQFKFEGDGWTVGYNAGVLWKAHEKLSFGVNFRSSTSVDLEGETSAYNQVFLPIPGFPGGGLPTFTHQSDADAEFRFPFSLVMGVSFRPTPKWNLEFNAEYTDWNYLNTVTIHQATPLPGLLPADIPYVLNWESSWYYEFGATRYFDNGWTISAGYIFNENSVPDDNYTPLVYDLDRHFVSLGAGHKGEHFDFDLTYQFGYGPTRTVSGSAPSAGGQTADGDYDFMSHAVFVTLGWRF